MCSLWVSLLYFGDFEETHLFISVSEAVQIWVLNNVLDLFYSGFFFCTNLNPLNVRFKVYFFVFFSLANLM